MIVPDINLLIYAYDVNAKKHTMAMSWWERCLAGTETVGLAWVAALGFLRIFTNPKVFANPMPVQTATAHVRSWLEHPQVQILHPGPRHADIFFAYLNQLGTAANLTTDAHLAALAQEYQAVLHTADTDFARFAGLRWINPLGK